jgi:predicted nucleotidyltransferase
MNAPGTACEQKQRLETELQAFIDRWSRDPSIKKIILFGSAARGDLRCDSDLDLIIVQETDKKLLSRLEPFYRDARVAMDILVYTPDEFAAMQEGTFLKNALQDGVVIYEAGARNG